MSAVPLEQEPGPTANAAGRVIVLPPRRTGNRFRRPVAANEAAAERRAARQFVSIWHVLIALLTCLLLSVVIDARGLIHSAQGMPDGPERTIALQIGQAGAKVGDFTHLTWAWDTLAAAHGYHPQPAVPPLLLAGPSAGSPAAPAGGAGPRNRGDRQRACTVPSTSTVAQGRTETTCRPRAGGGLDGSGSRQHAVHTGWRRPITRAHPLRLLVTGDSLTEFLGPDLVNGASAIAPVRGFTDTHYGTGLVRPDFVDWSLVARQQVAADNPDAVVVMMGGNDFQNIQLANGTVLLSGTPAWTAEYQRRAEICMRIWTQGGTRRAYWLAMPPARDDAWSRHNAEINLALRRAARRVPGAEYLNLNGPVTDHGQYADFVTVGGQPVLVREPDGIHFNAAGSDIVSHEMLAVLKHEWRLR